MRVTKTIREYVEKELDAKFKASYDALREIRNPVVKETLDAAEAIRKKACDDIKAMVADAGFETKDIYVALGGTYGIRDRETEDRVADMRRDLDAKKSKAVADILIALELGEATKDELRGLIEEVEV